MNTMRNVRGVALRLASTVTKARQCIQTACPVFEQLLVNTLPVVLQKRRQEFNVTELAEKLKQTPKRLADLSDFLQCVVCTTVLEIEGGNNNSFELNAEEHMRWTAANDPNAKKPYMWHLVEMCKHKERISTSSFFPKFDEGIASMGSAASNMNMALQSLVDWVLQSPVARRVAVEHCESKLRSSLSSFFENLSSQKIVVASEATLCEKSGGAAWPLLMATDLAELNLHLVVDKAIFSKDGGNTTDNLPHMVGIQMLQTVVARLIGEPIIVAALQGPGARVPLPRESILGVLMMHASVQTIILMASWAYRMLEVSPLDSVSDNIVRGLNLLKAACDELEGIVTSPSLANLDNIAGLNMTVRVGLASDWLACVRLVFFQMVSKVIDIGCTFITREAQHLDSIIPRWQAICTDTSTNETLAKNQLLQNPNKPGLEAKANNLKSELAKLKNASHALCAEPAWGEDERTAGCEALAVAAENNAFACLAVIAACKAVIMFKRSKRGPQMANNVIDILKKPLFKDISLPRHLSESLQNLSQQVAEASASADPAMSSTSGQPKRRRLLAKTEIAETDG